MSSLEQDTIAVSIGGFFKWCLLKGLSILALVYYKGVYVKGVLRHRRRPTQRSGGACKVYGVG